MEYNSLKKIPHYTECNQIALGLGFQLVEFQVVPQKNSVRVVLVIAASDPKKNVGVADCSKLHHALKEKIISFLGRPEDEVYMEVCSPGLERNIKNAAEFEIFKGREVRVWDKTCNDWIRGIIKDANETELILSQEESETSIKYENIAKAKFIHL